VKNNCKCKTEQSAKTYLGHLWHFGQ